MNILYGAAIVHAMIFIQVHMKNKGILKWEVQEMHHFVSSTQIHMLKSNIGLIRSEFHTL